MNRLGKSNFHSSVLEPSAELKATQAAKELAQELAMSLKANKERKKEETLSKTPSKPLKKAKSRYLLESRDVGCSHTPKKDPKQPSESTIPSAKIINARLVQDYYNESSKNKLNKQQIEDINQRFSKLEDQKTRNLVEKRLAMIEKEETIFGRAVKSRTPNRSKATRKNKEGSYTPSRSRGCRNSYMESVYSEDLQIPQQKILQSRTQDILEVRNRKLQDMKVKQNQMEQQKLLQECTFKPSTSKSKVARAAKSRYLNAKNQTQTQAQAAHDLSTSQNCQMNKENVNFVNETQSKNRKSTGFSLKIKGPFQKNDPNTEGARSPFDNCEILENPFTGKPIYPPKKEKESHFGCPNPVSLSKEANKTGQTDLVDKRQIISVEQLTKNMQAGRNNEKKLRKKN